MEKNNIDDSTEQRVPNNLVPLTLLKKKQWHVCTSCVTLDHTLWSHSHGVYSLNSGDSASYVMLNCESAVACAMYVSMIVLTRSTFWAQKIENRPRIDRYTRGILVNFAAENQCLNKSHLVQSVTVPNWPHETVALELVLAAAVHSGTAVVSIWKLTSNALYFHSAYRY